MNKAFSCLTKFLVKSLRSHCTELSKGKEGVSHYTNLINMFTALEKEATDSIAWKASKALEKEHTAAKKHHTNILFPGLQEKVAESVKNWNQSDEFRKMISSVFKIHEEGCKGTDDSEDRITTPDYREVLQLAMMALTTSNANRNIVNSTLTNRHIWKADKVFQDNETGEGFVGIGGEGRKEIGKAVTLQQSSGATKTGNTISVYLDQFTMRLLNTYRDVKKFFFVGRKKARVRFLKIHLVEFNYDSYS